MPWPVTIDGTTFTEANFSPYAYATYFPLLAQAMANAAGSTAAGLAGAQSAAATAQSISDGLTNARLIGATVSTAAVAITYALHQGKVVQITSVGTPAVAWADTGDGFFCILANTRTADVQIAVTGLTLTHPDGHTRVRAGGTASIIVRDDGVTRRLMLSGQTAA